MPTFTGLRGELSRTREQIVAGGGLVPKLALSAHPGGFAGFIGCQNKVDGVLGCRCAQMDSFWMHYRGVAMMRAFALAPDHIVSHTAFNCVGLLSWAGPAGQPYGGQQTSYTTPEMTVYSWQNGEEALTAVYDRLKLAGPPKRGALMAFKMNKVEFAMSADMSVLAMIVKENLEYSFFTPVATADIVFGAIEPVRDAEDPVARQLRMMNLSPDKDALAYEQKRVQLEGKSQMLTSQFNLIAAQAVPVTFMPTGFNAREPQPYSGLGVGRRESTRP